MDPTLEALLRSWPFEPWVVVPLLLSAGIYVRGWYVLRRRGARHFGRNQLLAFLGGLGAVFLALASPIEPFAFLLLQVHMVQHLLLMVAAPPLLWLGAPLLPMLRGLPVPIRQHWVVPFLRLPLCRACFRFLTQPVVAWVLFVAATWLWHAPLFYESTLRSDSWHYLEHGCFLATALLFWFPVVQPYPARPHFSRWLLLPYLFLADVQNTALSALLTFSDRVLYPHYAAAPRLWRTSPLDDQAAAGILMWVPGSLAYLVPLVWIAQQLLYGRGRDTGKRQRGDAATGQPISRALISARIPLPLAASPRRRVAASPTAWDLLNVPWLGSFLKWRHARRTMQIPLFLIALVVIGDGLFGPEAAPLNLAGVLPWIHWRGLVVLGLLVGGNFFCMACPFVLPRSLARSWLPGRRSWPRWLRAKWLALALLVLFFWAYEVFALWDSPWWTAWIALAYFLAAFVVDGFFRGAAFCKYVCPIGQFHFVQSLAAPLEVKVHSLDVCLHCATKDCIRGGPGGPGCELHLFQPRKAGNMDCTFCLDCIHACPHDNVGILGVVPGAELRHDRQRSGLGRFSRRLDVAALVLVLVFAAFANAAGMVAPVLAGQEQLAGALGLASPFLVMTLFLLGGIVLLPVVVVSLAAAVGGWWSGDPGRFREVAARFAYSLVPLGFGMWLAHYSFHFWTSADVIVPTTQRLALDLGIPFLGPPQWGNCCCATAAPWLLRLEIVFLDLGLLLSLYLGYRIALERRARLGLALKAFAPWAVLMVVLFAVGVWIVFQPMEMRGTMQG